LLLVFPIFSVEVSSSESTEEIQGEFGPYGLTSGEISLNADLPDGSTAPLSTQVSIDKSYPVYIIYIVWSLFSFAGIFLYKNSKRQERIVLVGFVLHLLYVVAVYAVFYAGESLIKKTLPDAASFEINMHLQIGFYLIVASLPFLILALRGINNDEK